MPVSALVFVAALVSSEAIMPEDAARLTYSSQRFVYLDVGQAHVFTRKDGSTRRIVLKSVTEHKDTVVELVRRADVVVEIDGAELALVCEPYRVPVERQGLRIQADTTSRWLAIPGRVQFSIWDAADPIVDTSRFTFPLPGYRLFSQGTQCYNEPVHLGHRDGDPAGQCFHHNYGFDMAGYEGGDKVASCIDGVIVRADSEEGTLAIEDARGIVFMYGHLDTILPDMRPGTKVKRGQAVGILGRKGGSGNFSHLHVGMFLSRERFEANSDNRNLNLYPWLIEAYRAASGARLLAVARPHHIVRTGESVRFDGETSLAFGSRIRSYRWEFHDGAAADGAIAEKVYNAPGTYVATLWVEDDRGLNDVDFCTVRVFSKDTREDVMPTLFMTYTPSERIAVDAPVRFRLWPQGLSIDPIRIDFGDGDVVERYEPYAELRHRFRKSGIHVVTAVGRAGTLQVTQKTKVVVE